MATDRRDITRYCIEAMTRAGIGKAQCVLRDQTMDELDAEAGEMSLFRTNRDRHLSLMGIVDEQKGTATINKTDTDSVDAAVAQVLELARSSQPDPANEISQKQPPGVFSSGLREPDLDLMYDRIRGFLDYAARTYPTLIVDQALLQFVLKTGLYLNSNGVDFQSSQGYYSFQPTVAAKEGSDTSSFNYTSFSSLDLARELHEYGSIDTIMRQSTEQMRPLELPGKFTGELIITPDCLDDFISYVTDYLRDHPMITGTSIYKDALGEEIAAPRLTLRSMPLAAEMADGYFFTEDGFAAENSTVIENGVLRSFLLSLYGSLKTGKPRSVNSGGSWMVDAGDTPFDEMVQSVEKGILLCRFSGGDPSDNGDFSGVAKNSYYIEGGEIRHPIKETMIAGNLAQVIRDIRSISSERVNFGGKVLPWIRVGGVTISGST